MLVTDSATKRCRGCGEVKPLDDFHRTTRTKDGRIARCKGCKSKYHAGYLSDETNRENKSARSRVHHEENKKTRHDVQRQSRYGITPEQYDTLVTEAGGRCYVCKKRPRGKRKTLVIDHDHACCPGSKGCGRCVRRLLCHYCNVGLGMLGDDPELLRAAALYIEEFRAKEEATC